MKVKNALGTVLFSSFLFVSSYCFCQQTKQSANVKTKAKPTPAASATNVLTQKEAAAITGEPGIAQDVKRVADAHPVQATSAVAAPASAASAQKATAAANGESAI